MTDSELENKLAELEEWLALVSGQLTGASTLEDFKRWRAWKLDFVRQEGESRQAAARD